MSISFRLKTQPVEKMLSRATEALPPPLMVLAKMPSGILLALTATSVTTLRLASPAAMPVEWIR